MTRPVAREDLVGDVLARDPALVAVFERHSPHFRALRNPLMRRTMSRLVTIEQAAGIAGIPVEALLRDLDAALGVARSAATPAAAPMPTSVPTAVDTTLASPAASTPPSPAHLAEVELDLRDDLRNGREPFPRIMAAVAALRGHEVLRLRTIFEPVPLYAVLAKRGYAHATERHAADDWSVRFWRAADDRTGERSSRDAVPAAAEAAAPAADDEIWLDVRGLEPPEPMLRTLAALDALPAGRTLVQVNARVPQFLLPILVERGFEFHAEETDPDRVLVRIRRRS